MKHTNALSALTIALFLSACGGDEQDAASLYGANPKLPEPDRGMLPSMKIAEPSPWGDQKPSVPEGYSISAIATDLKVPRQMLLLPKTIRAT